MAARSIQRAAARVERAIRLGREWLATAKPGERYVYFEGEHLLSPEAYVEGAVFVRDDMLRAAKEGRVHLIQKRIGPSKDGEGSVYQYIAERASSRANDALYAANHPLPGRERP